MPQKKKGLRPALYRLRPDQIATLRREALERAAKRGSGKPDASEIVREALDRYLPTEIEVAVTKPRHRPTFAEVVTTKVPAKRRKP